MAGLVGVLRQLGDLAEFAAEIFHELHEEVMATAARGHGLLLRVQQLEAEFPSVEKAFLCQTSHSHFAYNAGIDWHANLQIDQNLITRGDMPRFILDSYEECRGPPRLFMLDKFDVAGAGACLKRYSDPSFFKMELASSDIGKAKVQREKKARKIKKKASRWRNGEVVESSLASRIDFNLQSGISEQVPEKNPTRRVKLKSRHCDGIDTSRSRSYMENLLEMYSPVQKVLQESPKSQSIKSIDPSESSPKVHDILVDNPYKYSSFRERNPAQHLSKQTAQLFTNELENQKTKGDELFETLPEPFDKVQNMYSTFQTLEKKDKLFNSGNKTEGSTDSYESVEVEKGAPALQDREKILTGAECITEDFIDDNRFDDIRRGVDYYVDALNTLESETEIDYEIRVKSDPGFFNMDSQRVDTNEAQQELLAQFSGTDFVKESTMPLGLKNTFSEQISSLSDPDYMGQNMNSLDVPADSEFCFCKTHDKAFEEVHQNDEITELNSSICLLADGSSNGEASDIPNFSPEIGEASSGSCVADLTSLIHIHPQGNFDEPQLVSPDLIETSDHNVPESLDANLPCMTETSEAWQLDSNLPCMTETSEARQLDGSSLGSGDVHVKIHPAERAEELISEDMADKVDIPNHVSQKQDESTLEQVSAGDVVDLLLQEPKESWHQDAEDCSNGSLLPFTSDLCPGINSVSFQLEGLAEEMESDMQPKDLAAEITTGSVSGTHEVAGHLNGLSGGARDVSERTRHTEYDEEIDDRAHDMFDHIPQTQNEMVQNVPAGHFKDSSLSSIMGIGVPQQSIEEDTEVCSNGRTSPTCPVTSLMASHISVQPSGVDAEQENFIASHEELGSPRSDEDVEIADEGKIRSPNIPPLELEHLSDEGHHESHNVETTEYVLVCSRKETDDLHRQSNCEVKDGPLFGVDDFRLPSGSTVSELHKDTLQTEQTILFDDSTKSAAAKAVADYNELTLTYAPELCDFHIQAQEGFVPGDADLNLQKMEIIEASSSTNKTVLHTESTIYMSLSQDENLLVSAPVVSSSELVNIDLSDPSDAKLSNGVCQTMPSEYNEADLPSNIDEDNPTYSSECEQDFSSKASSPCIQESAEENLSSPIQSAVPDEIVSIVQESSMVSSHQESELLEPSDVKFEIAGSVEQDSTQKNSVERDDKQSEPGPKQDSTVITADQSISELDITPSNTGIHGQLDREASVLSECSSENTASSVAPSMSSGGLPLFAGFGQALSEYTPQQSSEQPISVPVPSFPLHEDAQEAPSLPPLPPLEWRMGKLQLGSLTSDGNSVQTFSGTNPFLAPLTADKKHVHCLVIAEAEMVQPTNLFAPLSALEESRFQCSLLSSENERVQPLRLSELPPIVEDEGYRHDSQGETVCLLNPSSLVSPIDDDRHLYSHDVLWGGMLHPSNPFAPLQSLENEVSQQGEKAQPSKDKIPQLGQLLPSLKLERSRLGALNTERDTVQSISPFLVESAAEDEKYPYNFGLYEGENMQHLCLPIPVSTAQPTMPQYGFVYSHEEYPFTTDYITAPTMEDVKPNRKHSSIRNRPRHPLIDAVAAHDKSKLRKVTELVQSSTKQKPDERDKLLEQIRKKSFNLKPAAMAKPNIKGPPTNLKVAAILEKANAIRQACVGSDEDEDADNWSDS